MRHERGASRRLRPNKSLQTRVCDVTHMNTTSQLSSYCGWVGVDKLWCVKTTGTPKNVTLPNHDTQTLCTEHLKRRDLAFNPKKLFIKGVDVSRKICVTHIRSTSQLPSGCGWVVNSTCRELAAYQNHGNKQELDGTEPCMVRRHSVHST